MELTNGQNVPLSGSTVTLQGAGMDLTALVLSGNGQVAGDADMVFFNQPAAPGVTLTGTQLTVNVTSLRPGAQKVALVASVDKAGDPIGAVTITDGPTTHTFTPAGLTTETAVVLVELYFRNGAWKVRAVGQGYSDGLAGLARDFGVDVGDDAPSGEETPAAPAPTINLIKGVERLPIDMQKKLVERVSLVKTTLAKQGAAGLKARVIAVLDTSGSTSTLYRSGVIRRAVERVMPVAAQVDDDAEMQMFLMGSKGLQVDDLQVGTLPEWTEKYCKKRPSEAGGSNNERSAIELVTQFVADQKDDIPTLVLFFHDGGVVDNRGTENAIRAAVDSPIFWQFVGLGKANYGILAKLDNLTGRRVDNTGFFALDDIDLVSDADLYARILREFPSWIRSYYPGTHPAVQSMS